jgi:hypothetical protein
MMVHHYSDGRTLINNTVVIHKQNIGQWEIFTVVIDDSLHFVCAFSNFSSSQCKYVFVRLSQ